MEIGIVLFCGQIEAGQVVMANYCPDEPKERGFWYDVEITRKSTKQVSNALIITCIKVTSLPRNRTIKPAQFGGQDKRISIS